MQINSIRDTRRSPEYFRSSIDALAKATDQYKETLNNNSNPVHCKRLRSAIARNSLTSWMMQYSAGEDIANLRRNFITVLDDFLTKVTSESAAGLMITPLDNYMDYLWIYSVNVLLEVSPKLHNRIAEVVGQRGVDYLYDTLSGYYSESISSATTMCHKLPFTFLNDLLHTDSAEEQIVCAQKYLKSYYKNLKRAYWHDSHLRPGLQYFGYWTFELAAAAKIKNADDRAFCDNEFYPRDLLLPAK